MALISAAFAPLPPPIVFLAAPPADYPYPEVAPLLALFPPV